MKIEACYVQLMGWLGELLPEPPAVWSRHVVIVREGDTSVRIGRMVVNYDPPAMADRLLCRLWTAENLYQILASPVYLGCTVQERMPAPGEDWNKGQDLADGDFSRKTWERIVSRMLGREMRVLSASEVQS